MLSLGEFKLNWVNKLCYLGIYFVDKPNRLFDVHEQIAKFYRLVHSILTYCGINKELLLLKLLMSKCAPIGLNYFMVWMLYIGPIHVKSGNNYYSLKLDHTCCF